MGHTIEVIDVRDRTALARELIVEESQLGQAIGSAFGAEYEFIESAGLRPLGEPFVIYRDRLAEHRWSVEICAPIAEAPTIATPPDLVVEHLPAGLVAATLHRGPYQTLGEAYDDMARWIGEHGYTIVGPPRERYLSEPGVAPDATETIIEMPVAKAEA